MHKPKFFLVKNLARTPLRSALCGRFTALILTLTLSVLMSSTQAKLSTADELRLYLPIQQQQFPGVIEQLTLLFSQAGLGKLKIQTADYWGNYQWAIRNGKPGLYYAAPHFLAWSLHQHNFKPLVRILEPLKYVIASRTNNANVFEINDLNKKTVCTQRALNLDYLLINSAFDNRLHSAKPLVVPSVEDAMTDRDSPCIAFSMSDHLFVEQERRNPGKFIRLQQSKLYNNYGFTLHPDLAPKYIHSLRLFLLSEPVQKLLQPLLRQTAAKTTLVNADLDDYPPTYLSALDNYWPHPLGTKPANERNE